MALRSFISNTINNTLTKATSAASAVNTMVKGATPTPITETLPDDNFISPQDDIYKDVVPSKSDAENAAMDNDNLVSPQESYTGGVSKDGAEQIANGADPKYIPGTPEYDAEQLRVTNALASGDNAASFAPGPGAIPSVPVEKTPEQLAAYETLKRFLDNPTLYQSSVDSTGRTAYDLAKQDVGQEAQTQRDRTLEQLRGSLAAAGITGPAAEQMIAQAMVSSDVQKAGAMSAISGQELATKDAYSREALLKAAGISSDIYLGERGISADMDRLLKTLESEDGRAQLAADTEIQVTNLVTDRLKSLEEGKQTFEIQSKAKMDAGFNQGASDRLSGVQLSDTDIIAKYGFDDNQLWAYKSGRSGQTAEDFTTLRDNVSKLMFAQIIGSEGAVSSSEIESMIKSLKSLYTTSDDVSNIIEPKPLGNRDDLSDSISNLPTPYLPGASEYWTSGGDGEWIYDTGNENLTLTYNQNTGKVIGSDNKPYIIEPDGSYYLEMEAGSPESIQYSRVRRGSRS